MDKLYENWSVELFKENIYIVNIICKSKSISVFRLNDRQYGLENLYKFEDDILEIPDFLPQDVQYMNFETHNKFHYQCIYIPYTLVDIQSTKTILQNV